MLSKFKIEKGHFVVGEVGGKSNGDQLATFGAVPFWMMVFVFAEFADGLDK